MNISPQSAFGAVESCYAAEMKTNSSLGDGQAQSNSSGLPASVIVQAVKRLE